MMRLFIHIWFRTFKTSPMAAVGMEIPVNIPTNMGVGWVAYGDCDESRLACGNSTGIFERMPDLSGNALNMR